jgi:hypothetical protein
VRIIGRLAGCVAVAFFVVAGAASAEDDFPLTGDYTQNVPCKGDGTDAREVKVKISPQQIDSKVAVCTFLDTKREGSRIDAHVQCQFPRGRRDLQDPAGPFGRICRSRQELQRDPLSLPAVTAADC